MIGRLDRLERTLSVGIAAAIFDSGRAALTADRGNGGVSAQARRLRLVRTESTD